MSYLTTEERDFRLEKLRNIMSAKDLGLALQFRTAGELALDLGKGRRLAFQYHHLSNLSISQPNPGAESYLVVFSLPLRR